MEGKPTLPLISALAHSTGEEHAIIRRSIATGGVDQLPKVIEIVQKSGALDYCQRRAQEETEASLQALSILPDTPYRQALINLTRLALSNTVDIILPMHINFQNIFKIQKQLESCY